MEALFPFVSASEDETRELGRRFGAHLNQGDVVALIGDLGAGKTQFVKGIASAFGIAEEDVSSPTFTIAHEYRGSRTLYHMDLYRLSSESELLQAGIEDYINANGICLIEWPNRAEHLLPPHTHIVRLTHLPEEKRRIDYVNLASL
jgi:tRNA threonylcarbamoyladenosine biosynthesis protein TsaE